MWSQSQANQQMSSSAMNMMYSSPPAMMYGSGMMYGGNPYMVRPVLS